ncbi:MAG TPA: serine/threonine-protein kinase [Polyangiaceae bacterium]|nr:serine/threonine-protein kinase [Polyangiaceae bacterium]
MATDRKGAGAQQPFGPFVLERRIAVGGSAEVFLARPKLGIQPASRLVVKKLLRAARETGDFDALEREAALHRAVVHRNVVNVFGAGMVDDEPYLAMEYVEGVDLYRLLRRADAEQRKFPVGLAAFIAMRVASALSAVHTAHDADGNALHIVHRDVTPSNIYLSIDGQIKLGDFGIARFEQRVKPAQPSVGLKGKFGYLAPEQVAGEPFDHRADLFALTAVFGEMLIGERVFPGSGQLAVLLAIRDVNIGPLREAASHLPDGILQLCERGLARDPDARFQDAAEFAAALSEFEQPSPEELQVTLAEWVNWAKDSSQLARQIEGQVRDSVQRMRAVRARSSGGLPAVSGATRPSEPPATLSLSNIRRADGQTVAGVTFAKLIEMIATGDLSGDDEVSLMGQEYRFIRDVHELGRHLLPSTTATTSRLFEPGIPDYQVLLKDTPMLDVLAHMRQKGESGAVFIERSSNTGNISRKEIYLDKGRLLHVASSEREELLGEYLVRRGRLTREQLETALGTLSNYGGRLGDTLIGIGMVDAVDVFRAIRDQGRDRVATLCGWSEGLVTFYRGTAPQRVEFPLDLDLASPMMAGAIVRAKGEPRALLPDGKKRILPGPRGEAVRHPRERGSAPASLIYVSTLTPERLTIDQAVERLMSYRTGHEARSVGAKEAAAALVTAELLGWVMWGE